MFSYLKTVCKLLCQRGIDLQCIWTAMVEHLSPAARGALPDLLASIWKVSINGNAPDRKSGE